MYFIALVAPEDINQQALKWKLWMKEKFKCEVALKSPAHITLIPPFWMKPEMEKELMGAIGNFSIKENSFTICLKGFSFFKPKVIFIDVIKNEQLELLCKQLKTHLLDCDKFPVKKEERLFHPHVTLATRDLYKKAFYEAWDYFKNKEYECEWITEGISLLRHNQKNWEVIHSSQFNKLF